MFTPFIELPEIMTASPRKHNEIVRKQMIAIAERHHREIMPLHFKSSAHTRYGHMDRNPMYIRNKIRRFGVGTDLIRTRRTMQYILDPANRRILVSGSADSGTIRVQLLMRLPFSGGTGVSADDAYYARLEAALSTERDPAKVAKIRRRLENRHNNRGKVGVTPAQMVKELRTVTGEEMADATRILADGYKADLRAMNKPRLRPGLTRADLN